MALFIPKDRKSLFRQFLAGMYDAVVITDPNGHILEVNPRTVEYFGREADDLVDQPVSVLIPGLKQEVVARIRRGLAGDRHVIVDANGVDSAGANVACEVAVSSIDLMNPGDLIFTIRNVERRRAYMNALWSRANAFERSREALFACAADGRVLEANAAFLSMFGLATVDEARRRVLADLVGGERLARDFRRALSGEATGAAAVELGDGQAKVEIALAPDVHGRKTTGVVGSIRRV